MSALLDHERPKSMLRIASSLLSGALLAGWLALPAFPQGGSCRQPPSTEVVLDHRLTMLWAAGSPSHPMGDPTTGVYRIDEGDKRASYRFTAPEDQTVASVWIHIGTTTLPPSARLRVELMHDEDGLPVPLQTTPGPADALFQPVAGWQKVQLTQSAEITACDVYHVLLEPGTPSHFNATLGQYVDLLTIVSRYPLAYQAEDPSTSEFRSFFDLDHAFMFEDPPLPMLSQWIVGDFVLRPFFAIQCSDGTLFGQPYDVHSEPKVLGAFVWGQKIVVSSTLTINHVAIFARIAAGTADDKLQAELYDASVTPASLMAQSIVVNNRPSVMNRAHWFGGRLQTPEGTPIDPQLQPGTYYLIVRSVPQEMTPKGYLVSMVDSTLPVPQGNLDPTYGDTASHAIFSPNGGTSWFAVPGAPDMAFMLSNLNDPATSAFGIFDEGHVRHTNSDVALTAIPAETLLFTMVTRNIGPAGAQLVFDFFDLDAGVSLLNPPGPRQDTNGTDPNSDTPSTIADPSDARNVPITVPSGLSAGDRWRVLMRVGHQDFTSGAFVIDDEVPWEIRIQ